jgi:hypothetical protein
MVNCAKTKMIFDLQYSHVIKGPNHAQLFHLTNTVTIAADVSSSVLRQIPPHAHILEDGSVQLMSTGSARSKKPAKILAAIDTIMQFQECGINPKKPLDVGAIRKDEEKEQHGACIQRAQMLLEMFNVSRPKFTTTPLGDNGNGGFVSSITMYYHGECFTADGIPGISKAEAHRNATVVAAETCLQDIMGKDSFEQYKKLIEALPANHVAALHVPHLPDDGYAKLGEVVGHSDDHAK